MVTIDCISDTHDFFPTLEGGDVLIHAGDATMIGSEKQILRFLNWYQAQPYKHKILIAGNHDFGFEKNSIYAEECARKGIHYLNDSGIEIDGIRYWGSPVQPWFGNWAFNRDRGPDISQHWDLIPQGTDILITHGPPINILDETQEGDRVGCADLLRAVERVNPRYHIFGHVHEAYGQLTQGPTTFINASILNRKYVPANKPVRIEYENSR